MDGWMIVISDLPAETGAKAVSRPEQTGSLFSAWRRVTWAAGGADEGYIKKNTLVGKMINAPACVPARTSTTVSNKKSIDQ